MSEEELIRRVQGMSPLDLPIAVYAVEEPGDERLEALVVTCNDRFRKIFGIAPDEPLPFLSSRFYRNLQERKRLRKKLDRANELGEDLEKLTIRLQAGGREIWAMDFTKALLDSNGKHIGALCCLVDITQEENTRRLLDELPVGIYHLDADDKVVECNRQFAAMIGYTGSEVLGRDVAEFYTELEEAVEFRRLILEQGTVIDYPIEVTKKSGDTFLASVSSALIGGEPYQGRVGAITDISQVERYRQIIDHLPIGLFKIRRSKLGEDLIEHCNGPFADIVGLDSKDMIGQPVKRFHESEATYNALLEKLDESDQRGVPLENQEVEVRTTEGERRILQVSTQQLRNRKGEIVGRVGAAQDVTRQRKLQEKVSKLTSDIGAVLHAYTHTLTMLSQTLEPVGEFLGPDPFRSPNGGNAAKTIGRGDTARVLSELRPRAEHLEKALNRVLTAKEEPGRLGAWDANTWNKLNSLHSALERPLQSSSPEVAHAYFREIAQGILDACQSIAPGHMSRELVRQLEFDARELGRLACLLSLASVKNAVVEMDYQVRALRENLTLDQREEIREDIGLHELIHAAIQSQSEYFLLRDIEIRMKVASAASRCVIRGARRDLVRALANLLHNAIKYSWSRAGEGPWIDLQATATEDKVAISIENWGVPIPRSEIPLVFKLGYRGRYSADRNRAGTGVGLHDSREVALSHNGDVTIDSRPTHPGEPDLYARPFLTTATLTLPIFRKES